MDGLSQDVMHERQVRIGVTDVFIAAAGTAVDAASGWEWQGVAEAGSPSYNFPYEMFELKTGHPNTTKILAIVAVEGEVGFTLEEYHAKAVELAVGGPAMTKDYGAAPAPTTVAASGSTVNQVVVAATGTFTAGMRIEVQTAAGLEDTYIESINGTTWQVKPAFLGVPVASSGTVKAIKQYVKPIGGIDVVKKAVKLVFTDRNLEQAIIYCEEVSSQGGYTPNFGDAKSNAKLPISLRAYGKEKTINGKKMPIVGYSYLKFPNVT